MKSPEEIQALKDDWKRDPCWDIEDSLGFEEHCDELKAYSLEMKAHWEELAQRHHDELASKVCPMTFLTTEDGCSYWNTCKVEDCAWWDEANDCCSIRAMILRPGRLDQ